MNHGTNERKIELQNKIASQIPITTEESLEYLKHGNGEFVLELNEYQSQRGELKTPKEYDAAIITCSDARCDCTLFRDFTNTAVAMMQVAGNVVDLQNKAARAKIDRVLSKVKNGGTVLETGHINCGAVDANTHADHYVGKISRHVDFLVGLVDRRQSTNFAKDDYKANAINQAAKLENHPQVIEKGLHVKQCLFDFTDGEQRVISYLKEGSEPAFIETLRESGIAIMKYASENGYGLITQYAHAIVICDPMDIGRFTNPRILFNGRLNELFCVSAIEESVSSDAIASIEYALLKVNGVKDAPHVVVLHSDRKTAEKLKSTMLATSEIIKSKTKDGSLITVAVYNKETGEIII